MLNLEIHDNHAQRELIAAVIQLAVHDSTGDVTALPCGHKKQTAQRRARKWLVYSNVCEAYCVLIGIDRVAMLDRLQREWRTPLE